MEKIYAQIAALAEKYQAEKIILFGSRARGDNQERSDIDLAVYGILQENHASFWADIDELPTLLKFDLVHISADIDCSIDRKYRKRRSDTI